MSDWEARRRAQARKDRRRLVGDLLVALAVIVGPVAMFFVAAFHVWAVTR